MAKHASKAIPAVERFWPKVDKNGPIPAHRPDLGQCWVWTAYRDRGYGKFHPTWRTSINAHIWAYTNTIGPVPSGLTLDHLCRNRACCNPDHLEVVTRGVNVLRGDGPSAQNSRKTHCKHGHPFDSTNTKILGGRYRRCRTCLRQTKARYYRRRKATTHLDTAWDCPE